VNDETSDDQQGNVTFWLLLTLLITHVGACLGGMALAHWAWP